MDIVCDSACSGIPEWKPKDRNQQLGKWRYWMELNFSVLLSLKNTDSLELITKLFVNSTMLLAYFHPVLPRCSGLDFSCQNQ